MAKVNLALSFASAETTIQHPRSIDKIWLFAKPQGVFFGRWYDCVVAVRLESHDCSEEWRIDVGGCMRFAEEHVIGHRKDLDDGQSQLSCQRNITTHPVCI